MIQSVNCMVLPIKDGYLLLPRTTIGEVVTFLDPRTLRDKPDWFMGYVKWRGSNLPLVQIESFAESQPPAYQKSNNIAVIKRVAEGGKFDFFGIFLQGFPKLATITRESIEAVNKPVSGAYQMDVIFDGQRAFIPNLELIQSEVNRIL